MMSRVARHGGSYTGLPRVGGDQEYRQVGGGRAGA
jgi:hypothetical protein